MAIIRCSCENKQQDEIHGPHRRVGNKTSAHPATYRCTSCLKEVSESQVIRA